MNPAEFFAPFFSNSINSTTQRRKQPRSIKQKRKSFRQHQSAIQTHFQPGKKVSFLIEEDGPEDEPIHGYCVAVSELGVSLADGLTFEKIAEARTYPVSYIQLHTVKSLDNGNVSVVISFPLTPP